MRGLQGLTEGRPAPSVRLARNQGARGVATPNELDETAISAERFERLRALTVD
jgi:hypothetical protein